jgi:hypothetical protein
MPRIKAPGWLLFLQPLKRKEVRMSSSIETKSYLIAIMVMVLASALIAEASVLISGVAV